jgi:hypothetical protein
LKKYYIQTIIIYLIYLKCGLKIVSDLNYIATVLSVKS